MAKYRKLPVVVEAEQWQSGKEMDGVEERIDQRGPYGIVDTLKGIHIVTPGDFIITGIKGEKYPCKPDIFFQTYEPVEEKSDE